MVRVGIRHLGAASAWGNHLGDGVVEGRGRDRLASLDNRAGVSAQHVALERALWEWREAVRDRLGEPETGGYPDGVPDLAASGRVTAESDCLVDSVGPLPKPDLLRDAARTLTDRLAQNLEVGAALRTWIDADPDGPEQDERLARWFTAAWRFDRAALQDLADASTLDPDVLAWAGRQLCRPFFHHLGRLFGEQGHDQVVPRRTCPCCGGLPRLGRLEREEGRRYLWCDLCDVQWRARRLTCPFCGTTNQKQLGYLTIEGSDRYRIDLCEACRGYLRVIDERDLPEGKHVDFLVEDIGTVHLSMVAEKQGYRTGRVQVREVL